MKRSALFLSFAFCWFLPRAQNIGVGTNTPGARLHVVGVGNSSATSNFMLKNSNNDTLLRMTDDGKITIGYNAPTFTRTLAIGGNGISFYRLENGVHSGSIYPSNFSSNSLFIDGGEDLVLTSATGHVGINTYSPSVSLQITGAIAITPQITAFLGGGSTGTVTVENRSVFFLRNTLDTDKNIVLTDGLTDGQRLTIVVRNSGTGSIIFIDNPSFNNTDLSVAGSFVMGDDDVIEFIWDQGAGYWIETSRSDN